MPRDGLCRWCSRNFRQRGLFNGQRDSDFITVIQRIAVRNLDGAGISACIRGRGGTAVVCHLIVTPHSFGNILIAQLRLYRAVDGLRLTVVFNCFVLAGQRDLQFGRNIYTGRNVLCGHLKRGCPVAVLILLELAREHNYQQTAVVIQRHALVGADSLDTGIGQRCGDGFTGFCGGFIQRVVAGAGSFFRNVVSGVRIVLETDVYHDRARLIIVDIQHGMRGIRRIDKVIAGNSQIRFAILFRQRNAIFFFRGSVIPRHGFQVKAIEQFAIDNAVDFKGTDMV